MIIQQKSHSQQAYKTYEMPTPGYGGLNIQDLEYNCAPAQSPDMLNMMLKNGSFGKRYGQQLNKEFESTIYAIGEYKGELILHTGTKMVKYNPSTKEVSELSDTLTEDKGIFINFNRNLYYLQPGKFTVYDGETYEDVEPYAPDICINRTPDGLYSDLIEDYNRLGAAFKNTFNGDGSSRVYHLIDSELDSKSPICEVDGVETTAFSYDTAAGTVTFNSAPAKGQNNVVITAYKTDETYIDSILNCKYWTSFGGQNNGRLFLAGNGNAIYYYSEVFDATYFPESNYATLGNGEDDITGFGNQYDVLIVFKPKEMYAISYYYDTDVNGDQKAMFSSGIVSANIGCDVPKSIDNVKNRLTWVSTIWGVCTLNSTVIKDERNVKVISRNINGGNRAEGLLQEPNLNNAQAVNFDGKYWVVINGNAYVWDYEYSPYTSTGDDEVDSKRLSWFKWNNIYVDSYDILQREIYYVHDKKLCELTYEYNDFGEIIPARYMTPMLDFDAMEYLKTIKKCYFFVRGDTPSVTHIKYITDENPEGEEEQEDIQINTKLWKEFTWHTFGWSFVKYARTFARNCSIKKVTLFGILMENNEKDRDMSLSQIRMIYIPVKRIK